MPRCCSWKVRYLIRQVRTWMLPCCSYPAWCMRSLSSASGMWSHHQLWHLRSQNIRSFLLPSRSYHWQWSLHLLRSSPVFWASGLFLLLPVRHLLQIPVTWSCPRSAYLQSVLISDYVYHLSVLRNRTSALQRCLHLRCKYYLPVWRSSPYRFLYNTRTHRMVCWILYCIQVPSAGNTSLFLSPDSVKKGLHWYTLSRNNPCIFYHRSPDRALLKVLTCYTYYMSHMSYLHHIHSWLRHIRSYLPHGNVQTDYCLRLHMYDGQPWSARSSLLLSGTSPVMTSHCRTANYNSPHSLSGLYISLMHRSVLESSCWHVIHLIHPDYWQAFWKDQSRQNTVLLSCNDHCLWCYKARIMLHSFRHIRYGASCFYQSVYSDDCSDILRILPQH